MIPEGLFWTTFIRVSIIFFRSVAPLSILHALLYLTGLAPTFVLHGIRLRFEFITIPETLFYLLVYLPRSHALQRATAEGTSLTRQERRDLFDTCLDSVPDTEHFLHIWFRGAPVNEIRKDEVKEWLAWGFWNTFTPSGIWSSFSPSKIHQEELDEYLAATEKKLGHEFEAGHGPHRALRPTVDNINIQHRPLFYYICGVGLMDTRVFVKMWSLGFQHRPVSRYCGSFPFRPLSAFCRRKSPVKDLSYWYRPHTSKCRMPVLFIHGIGIGLITYTDFFAEFIELNNPSDPNDQIGIIAIEIMPISFRITSPTLQRQEMVSQIKQILRYHGWDRQQLLLAAHSYGTVIATHLLRDPALSSIIGPVVLVDPITLWVHMGDVAYNFTAKKPQSASEHQLHYFACTDMGAAHAVTRRFVWTENVLWKKELIGRQYALILGERDIIMDAKRCRLYLLAEQTNVNTTSIDSVSGAELIKAGTTEVLWLPGLNHAEVFDFQRQRKLLVDMVWRHCGI